MPHGEVTTDDLVHDALVRGKQVFVPYIYTNPAMKAGGHSTVMDMVSLHSSADFKNCQNNRDAWGIPSLRTDLLSARQATLDPFLGGVVDSVNASEPTTGIAPPSSLGRLDMIVMPGMAFDRTFGRLGHGKGFYDFFLHRYQSSSPSTQDHNVTMPFLGKFRSQIPRACLC